GGLATARRLPLHSRPQSPSMSTCVRRPASPPRAVPLGLRALLLASLCAAALPPLAHAQAVPQVTPSALPYSLAGGWEQSDDGASWRPVDPVRDEGPYGGIRFYRMRLDLTACRGIALAFTVPSLRDADEASLDGIPIGGLGGFPPRLDPANL